jgi:regulator of replication initiation timing
MNKTIIYNQFDKWVDGIEHLNHSLEDLNHTLDDIIQETDYLNTYYTHTMNEQNKKLKPKRTIINFLE